MSEQHLYYLVGVKDQHYQMTKLASTKIFDNLLAAIRCGLAASYQNDVINVFRYQYLLHYRVHDWTVSLLNRYGIVIAVVDDTQLQVIKKAGLSLIQEAPFILYLPVFLSTPQLASITLLNSFKVVNTYGEFLTATFKQAVYFGHTTAQLIPQGLQLSQINATNITEYLDHFLGQGGNILELKQMDYQQIQMQIK